MFDVAKAKQHIAKLSETVQEEHEAMIVHEREKAQILRDSLGGVCEIRIPPIETPADYATALHEFGHVFGPHQDSGTLERERGAWQWAAENTRIGWTPEMEK